MRNIPNFLSLMRLILSPYVLLLAYRGQEKEAAILFLLLATTDALDGAIARLFRAQSLLGKFLDPLADKFLLFFGLLAVTFYTEIRARVELLYLLVFRDISLIAGTLFLRRFGFIPEPSLLGKLTTFFLSLTVFTGFLTNLYGGGLVLSLFGVFELISLFLVVVSGIYYGVKGVSILLSKFIIERRQ